MHPPPRPLNIAMLAALLLPAACSEPKVNNTLLGSADLVAMTDQMVASLLNAQAIAGRTGDSAPWFVTMDRVSNRTDHVMPGREKWLFIARLRAKLNESDAMAKRNIRFVLSAAAAQSVGDEGAAREGRRTNPTHALASTFYSETTANRAVRSDHYLCAFQLTDAGSDAVVWEDAYEVKYAVLRNKLD